MSTCQFSLTLWKNSPFAHKAIESSCELLYGVVIVLCVADDAQLYDPEQSTQLLNQQLRALGLYAAHTIGDGNCLFRALSDQLYGTDSQHLELRKEICDWIASRKDRYAPFVDDERGIDEHLRCMRKSGECFTFCAMLLRDRLLIRHSDLRRSP